MRKQKLKQKGITLIALVITIIVLLILAGVSIATLTGEGGILKKATYSKEQTEIKEGEDVIKLKISEAQIENKAPVNLEYLANFLENDEEIVLSDINEVELILEYGNHAYRIDDKIMVTYLGTKENWQSNSYAITTDLTEGITLDNKRKRVQKGESYQANILVEDGIEISRIEVKMGEEIINIDTETKSINIEQVTDNILITAKKLVAIEMFDYMRKNNLTPSNLGITASWSGEETRYFDSSKIAANKSNGSGNFSGNFTLGSNTFSTLGIENFLTSIRCIFYVSASYNNDSSGGNVVGTLKVNYEDGTNATGNFTKEKVYTSDSGDYPVSVNVDVSKKITNIQISFSGLDRTYGGMTIGFKGLEMKASM